MFMRSFLLSMAATACAALSAISVSAAPPHGGFHAGFRAGGGFHAHGFHPSPVHAGGGFHAGLARPGGFHAGFRAGGSLHAGGIHPGAFPARAFHPGRVFTGGLHAAAGLRAGGYAAGRFRAGGYNLGAVRYPAGLGAYRAGFGYGGAYRGGIGYRGYLGGLYGAALGYGGLYGYRPWYGYGYGYNALAAYSPAYWGSLYGYSPWYSAYGYYPAVASYSYALGYDPYDVYGYGLNDYGLDAYGYVAPADYPEGYVPDEEATVPSQGPPAVPTDNAAHLLVRVPADAELWFDEYKTPQTGPERAFVSPPLTPGRDFTYQIRARWMEDGRPVDHIRTVHVHANMQAEVDMTRPQAGDVTQAP